MKNLFYYSFFFVYIANGQQSAVVSKTINIKLFKTITYNPCENLSLTKTAIVLGFAVQNEEDRKKYGDTIYAAMHCDDYPRDRIFTSNKIYHMEIHEVESLKNFHPIINEDLFDKNIDKKKYWIMDLDTSIKVPTYGGPLRIR